jgi:hypothetical protein
MSKSRINFILWIAVFLVVSSPLAGEKVSLKISYNTASVSTGDMNTWIDSYNTFWKDWQAVNNGQLNGQIDPLNYGSKYEVELRIPIIFGLALNLSGSHFNNASGGAFDFVHETQNQSETDSIENEIKGYPIKIGFSYSQSLPFLENLYIFAGVGRHITFLKYRYLQDYTLRIGEYSYNLKNDYTYNSEALGVYASLGLEYDLIKHIAIVIEAEKVWSKADGFKGPYESVLIDPFEGTQTKQGKASLYFYENKQWWSNTYYSSLSGHNKRPEDPEDEDYPVGAVDITNIRQGEFDLSSLSFKIGIRFKF